MSTQSIANGAGGQLELPAELSDYTVVRLGSIDRRGGIYLFEHTPSYRHAQVVLGPVMNDGTGQIVYGFEERLAGMPDPIEQVKNQVLFLHEVALRADDPDAQERFRTNFASIARGIAGYLPNAVSA